MASIARTKPESPPSILAIEPSTREKQAIEGLAKVLRVIPQRFEWEEVRGEGRLLTVQLPWARVAIARTADAAIRASTDKEKLLESVLYLIESITVVFPRSTPESGWAPVYDLLAQRLTAPDRAFLEWALEHQGIGLKLGPHLTVVGRWQVWPLAVLLIRLDSAEPLFQLRRRSEETYALDPDSAKRKPAGA